MKGTPGSPLWLLQHELRLFWFGAAPAKAGNAPRRPGASAIAVFAVAWIVLHAVAWFLLRKLDAGLPQLAALLTLLLMGCATFMVSSAISSSVVALYERGDLDLLLSSPLSSRSIFTVRLAGIIAGTAGLYVFLAAPVAHAGVLLGQFQWLGLYPVVLGLAALCGCMAMLLTLGLIRLIGARRTRVVAQLIGVLAGALLFILSQLYAHFVQASEGYRALGGWLASGPLGADSPVWLLGRAALGEPKPILALCALALLAFFLTARSTHRFFVHGLQQAASSPRVARASGKALSARFDRRLFTTIVVKEWRLLARDPHLISQVLLQLIYLLPLCLVVFRDTGFQAPAVGAGLTIMCASLTASLAWIMISAEDAPDLLRVSPAPQRRIRLAKLAAAVLPPLAVIAVPLLWMMIRMPVAALVVAITTMAAMAGAALIVMWCAKPGARSQFKAKANFLVNFLELLSNLSWAAVAWQLVSASQKPMSPSAMVVTLLAALAGFLMIGAAWLLRRSQD
jgi:ABC-2 type transport system permease protein